MECSLYFTFKVIFLAIFQEKTGIIFILNGKTECIAYHAKDLCSYKSIINIALKRQEVFVCSLILKMLIAL